MNCDQNIKRNITIILLFNFQLYNTDAVTTIVCVLRFMQDWERCERGIGGSLEKLRAFKRQLSQPLPDHHEDLQAEQMRCKVTVVPILKPFYSN